MLIVRTALSPNAGLKRLLHDAGHLLPTGQNSAKPERGIETRCFRQKSQEPAKSEQR